MILISIIILFFAVWLFIDYKRGVLMLTAWILLLDIFSLFGGKLTAFQLLAFLACALGVIHYYNSKRRNRIPYPFWLCGVAVFISLAITNTLTPIHRWPSSILNVICVYVFPFFVWYALDDPRNMRRFVRYTMIFLILLVGYGIFEEVTNSNPFMEWLTKEGYASSAVGLSDRMRFGLRRIQSFLAYNGALGVSCIINILFIAFVNTNHKVYIRSFSRWVPYLIIGLYLCAFFTGSRSIIFAVVVGSLYFASWRILRNRWIWIVIMAAIIIIPFATSYFQEVIHTFEDTQAVGGSSTEMREGQFNMAFQFMNRSTWFGNGVGYTFGYVVKNYREVMMGAESIWIPLMIEQGIIGIVAYLIVLFVPFRYCLKIKNYVGIFIILAFITAKTMSSIPGMSAAYFLIYVVATCRLILYKKASNNHTLPKGYINKQT